MNILAHGLFGYVSRYVTPTISPAPGSQGAPVPGQSDLQRQSSEGDGSEGDGQANEGGQTGNTEGSQGAEQGNLRDPGILDPAQSSNQL